MIFFTVQLWLPNDSSLLSAISAVFIRSIPALQSSGKLHKGKLPYLITSPGDKVILELVKGFTSFVGLIQRISNSITYNSLWIVRNCTADTPITSSSLFAQRAQRATRIATRSDVTQYITYMRFQSLLCSMVKANVKQNARTVWLSYYSPAVPLLRLHLGRASAERRTNLRLSWGEFVSSLRRLAPFTLCCRYQYTKAQT